MAWKRPLRLRWRRSVGRVFLYSKSTMVGVAADAVIGNVLGGVPPGGCGHESGLGRKGRGATHQELMMR